MKSLFIGFKKHSLRIAFGLLILGLVLFMGYLLFFHLGIHPFVDFDEAIYARVAREAVVSRNYQVFTYFGRLWFEKPPLGIWLTAIGFKFFGFNEYSARLSTAVSGLLTVVLTGWVIWRLFRSKLAVCLSIGSYYISFPFIVGAYFLNFDTLVGLFILMMTYSFWESRKNPNYFYWFGIALGLGVLTKSVVAFFPFPALVLYSAITKDFRFLRQRQFYYAVVLSAVIILPWHIYQTTHHGRAFWDNYLLYHVWYRFTRPLETNGAPFDYFFQILRQNSLYFFMLAAAAIYFLQRSFRQTRYLYILLAAVSLFLIISISETKLAPYLIIVYPYLVIMISVTLADILSLSRFGLIRYGGTAVLLSAFLFLGFSLNAYKLAKGETELRYSDNKQIGQYLTDHYTDLPVYINPPSAPRVALGWYADREIEILPPDMAVPDPEELLKTKPLMHTATAQLHRTAHYLYLTR